MREILVGIAFGALLCACGGGSEESVNKDSRRLYLDEKRLLERYIDSVKRIPDSGDVTGLMQRYVERLAELNMEFPAETDVNLNRGENDTLFMLTERLYLSAGKKGFDPNDIKEDKRDSILRITFPSGFENKASSSVNKATRVAPAIKKEPTETKPGAEAEAPSEVSAPTPVNEGE